MTRFEFPNYTQITKLDKSEYNEIKKSIFWIFQKLGKSGTTGPVAYDTAFAARVPLANDLSSPAFPQCLQWLRDHQTHDGTWGEEYPPSIHSKILNTLAATLALSQWNHQQDQERLRKGIEALRKMTESLPMEKTEDSTFEMILSSLVDDARQLELNIPYESYEWFVKIGREAVKRIQRKLLTNKPNECWALLEAAGTNLDLHPIYYRGEIKRHGLIAAQPSTTAFILRQARLKGEDYIEAEWALGRLSSENDGGLPHLYRCDNFDLILSLDLLTKVGINPKTNDKHEAAKNAIETLRERWTTQNGIGFSSTWQFCDFSCNEAAVNVYNTTLNERENVLCVTKTKKYGRDDEINPKKVKQLKSTEIMDQPDINTFSYIEPLYPKNVPFSLSARSASKYYDIMCKVFKAALDTKRRLLIIDEIVKSQKSDGGWGGKGSSSAEETAYVCLAMFALSRHNSQILHRIDFLKLVEFIQDLETPYKYDSLWYWKVSFFSPGLAEAAIIAAKYAVFQMQRVCIMTDAFNENRLDLEEIEILDGDNQIIFNGYCLRSDETAWPKNNENQEEVMKSLLINFFDGDSPSPYFKRAIDEFFVFSYLQNPAELPVAHRVIDLVIILASIVLDDIVDLFLPGKSEVLGKLQEFKDTVIAILKGKHQDPETVPAYDYPECLRLIQHLFIVQNAIQENGWDDQYFVRELENLLNNALLIHKDLCNNIALTTKRYLQIHKISTTLTVLVQQNCMIGRIGSPESENLSAYQRFLDVACKACRAVTDFPSVEKDKKMPTLDNYCLRLQHQYNLSVQEAVQMTVRKGNKEILKMHTLKKVIQNDPQYKKYKDLPSRMKYVETIVDAGIVWALSTCRYKSDWTIKRTKIKHEEQDSAFVRKLSFN